MPLLNLASAFYCPVPIEFEYAPRDNTLGALFLSDRQIKFDNTLRFVLLQKLHFVMTLQFLEDFLAKNSERYFLETTAGME